MTETHDRMVDIAWVAGLIEGEGTFRRLLNKATGGVGVTVAMTDRDVLEKAQRLFGGVLYGPYGDKRQAEKPHWKDVWVWSLHRQSDAVALMMTIYPFMGERRREAIRNLITEWRNRWGPSHYLCRNGLHERPGGGTCRECARATSRRHNARRRVAAP